MFVHAHPDDESILTGGTIARYLAAGIAVTVVTCTLGEEGEVIGDEFAELVADRADQLGGYRIGELGRALARLGSDENRCQHEFLGGAGRWRDSGMFGTPAATNPRAFINADLAEPVDALVALIAKHRPEVVVGYDPDGGYGHPDHVRVYDVTTAAFARTQHFPRPPSKLYWAVVDRDAVEQALHDVPTTAGRAMERGDITGLSAHRITTRLDVSEFVHLKLNAMAEHATQISVDRAHRAFALSNQIWQPVLMQECYVLAEVSTGLRLTNSETDLFEGCHA